MASCSFSGWVYVVKDVASRFEGQPVPSVPSGGSFGGATATGSQVLPRFMALVQQTDQSCVLLYKRDPQTAPQEVSAFSTSCFAMPPGGHVATLLEPSQASSAP